MITTFYRRLASSQLQDWTHTSTFPATRDDVLNGEVPVDEFFAGQEPQLTQTMINAACKRAERQAAAMRRIDAEFEYKQEVAA